jgi:CDP-paratose 2-epimerase
VLAGLGGEGQSQQLVEHNLVGTLNLLELCRKNQAGLILLSTSRVYSIEHLTSLPLLIKEHAFTLDQDALPTHLQSSVTASGINETFSTQAPISLYGATKLASEVMAMEYGRAFDLPVWINRCGVMAGAGQFARADQGIFSFWIHRWSEKKALRYIGFGGHGYQVRDCLHPADLCPLIDKQLVEPLISDKPRIVNLSGGILSAMSLAQLSQWCCTRLTPAGVASDITPRPYDLPWVVLDHSLATQAWGWKPQITKMQILEQLADFAEENPDWLIQTGGDR